MSLQLKRTPHVTLKSAKKKPLFIIKKKKKWFPWTFITVLQTFERIFNRKKNLKSQATVFWQTGRELLTFIMKAYWLMTEWMLSLTESLKTQSITCQVLFENMQHSFSSSLTWIVLKAILKPCHSCLQNLIQLPYNKIHSQIHYTDFWNSEQICKLKNEFDLVFICPDCSAISKIRIGKSGGWVLGEEKKCKNL